MGERPVGSGQRELLVEAADAGIRLDQLLAARFGELSRTRAKQLIIEAQVTVGGRTIVEPKYRVNAGEAVTVTVPDAAPAKPKAQAIALDIVYEDDDLIVIDKPAGMVVHPAPGHGEGTLVNALIGHCGEQLSGIGGVRRPGIVHRLDKDTSGLMVVAKSDRAHQGLAAQFADHGRTGPLQRAYLAFVWGAPPRRAGTIEAPLARSRRSPTKREVSRRPDAKIAITHYEVRETFGRGKGGPIAALVECRLETGRTHQIRVHMAHIGCPLIADKEYGAHFFSKLDKLRGENPAAAAAIARLERQALHACLLGFEHPVSGEVLVFESEFPEELGILADLLRATE